MKYNCVYCNKENTVNIEEIENYQICSNCDGINDIEIDENGKVIVEAY